jgi:hypothetical protein
MLFGLVQDPFLPDVYRNEVENQEVNVGNIQFYHQWRGHSPTIDSLDPTPNPLQLILNYLYCSTINIVKKYHSRINVNTCRGNMYFCNDTYIISDNVDDLNLRDNGG